MREFIRAAFDYEIENQFQLDPGRYGAAVTGVTWPRDKARGGRLFWAEGSTTIFGGLSEGWELRAA